MLARLLSSMLLLFTLGSLKAQVTTYQTALKDSTLNILYTHFDNEVTIKNLPEGAIVKFNDKIIEPYLHYSGVAVDYKTLHLLPNKEGNYALQVLNSNNEEIYKRDYQAVTFRDPITKLGILKDTAATVAEILAYPALVCFVPNDNLREKETILFYTITIIRGLNVLTINTSGCCRKNYNGAPFDSDIQGDIRKMRKGDKLFVENIKAMGPDRTTRGLAPIVVTIK